MKTHRILILTCILLLFKTSYSQDHIFQWANSAGSASRDYGHTIVVDSLGNSYSAGGFQGMVDFDPGTTTLNLTSNGSYDCFLQKFSPSGNLIWAKTIGGIGNDVIESITFDSIGNLIVIGYYEGTIDFDPNSGVVSKTASSSSREIFVLKLSDSGNFMWVKTFAGSTYSSFGTDIKCDANGNIYTCGYFSGTVDFDPGSLTYQLSATNLWDLFVQKMDHNGDFVWAKKFGGNGYNYLGAIDINIQGDVFLTGLFENLVDFDPNTGSHNISSNGKNDAFILKLSSVGNLVWAHNLGAWENDQGKDVVSDSAGNVYMLGDFSGNVDFDPDTSAAIKNSAGEYDVFVLKLGPGGAFQWARSIGGTGYDNGNAIAISPNGSVVISGTYQNTVDFDPGAGSFSLSSSGDYDAFVLWMDSNGNFLDAKSLGGPDFDRPDDFCFDELGNIYITGAHSQQADFNPGPGVHLLPHVGDWDIFAEKLSICYPNTGIDTIYGCDSYTWINGVTYTSNNNSAVDTLVNNKGCDSIVNLNLYLFPSSNTVDTITGCHPFTWIDGNTYYNNDTAIVNYTNINGCDSSFTAYFSILQADLAITKNANKFTVGESSDATYQWLYCDSNYAPIIGATSRTYTAVANGNYAVAVTKQGCTDTSNCVSLTNIYLQESNLASKVWFYPNPSSVGITIHFEEIDRYNVKIYDTQGRVLLEKLILNQPVIKLKTGLSPGVYTLQINKQFKEARFQLVIQ